MPPRNSSTRNSALAAARFASARSVPAISIPMPANATVPSSSSPSAGTTPAGTFQPSAIADDDDEHELRRPRARARSRSWRRAGRRATAASTRAASARRSAARTRSRCRATPSRPPSPTSASTPGTRKSTGSAKSVVTASTLAKNTRTPIGTASVTIDVLAAPHLQRAVSARACAAIARACSLVLPRGFGGDLQEHLFERTPAGLQRGERDVAVAQEAARGRRCAPACPGRARRTPPVVPRRRRRRPTPSAAASARRSRPGVGREPDLVGRRVLRQLGRRAERGEPAAGDDRDAVAQVLGLVHRRAS